MKLGLIISDVGIFEINLDRVHSPLTASKLMIELPISSRGIKRGHKFIIPTNLKTKFEGSLKIFHEGEISHDPSSGNITLYLEKSKLIKENYLGKIVNDFDKFQLIKLTHGIKISEN